MQIGGEKRRFIAARARADLDDRISVVERIARNDEWLQFFLELRDALLEAAQLGARLLGELGVVNENELTHLRELVFVFVEAAGQLDDASETSVLSAELRQLVRVAKRCWIGESPLDLSCASQRVRESVSERQGRASARLLAELLSEPLDAPSSIHEALLPGEEGMALRADVRVNLGLSGSSLERIAAGALHSRRMVFRMDIGFHVKPRGTG